MQCYNFFLNFSLAAETANRSKTMASPVRGSPTTPSFTLTRKVYLLGAGAGDPELLTEKARHLLQTAEIVVYHDGVPQGILELIPAWTQVLSTGKQSGHAGMTEGKVYEVLLSSVRRGHDVLVLKSVDSRSPDGVGEEMEALRRAGIHIEVVPATTAQEVAAAQVEEGTHAT